MLLHNDSSFGPHHRNNSPKAWQSPVDRDGCFGACATHLPCGLSVKVQTERSQHANKRLARALLACRLVAQERERLGQNRAQRRIQHYQVERGNARRVFKGEDFCLLT